MERVDRPVHRFRHGIQITVNGSGAVVPTGYVGDLILPFACQPVSWRIALNQTGSIVIDLYADLFVNWPPTAGDSICGTNKPTVTGATTASGDCTGWTPALAADTVVRVNIDSVASAQRVLLALTVKRLE